MRRIDHLVIAVRDLDGAADFYRRLGFQVGARNRHPWGTENRLVQFRSSFLELITTGDDPTLIPPHGDGVFSFGAFVRDSLARRDGFPMLVLDSDDAKGDAAAFAAAGIGAFQPFFFERTGLRPDGTPTHVAFTLAFAADPLAPQAGYFVCQQHVPENFWNPAFQIHANGAENVSAVTLTTAQPQAHAGFLSAFGGSTAEVGSDGSITVPLQGGRIVASATGAQNTPLLSGFAVRVPSLEATTVVLRNTGIPFSEETAGSLHISPDTAFGTAITFEQA